ncbi:Fimbrial protein [Pseudomonas reidholzensis]|uniref:Fimbrial protein n=1 Tax=Pseudomonas reidholzensis TaxID=1785162 RepID=A0A383S1E2_9PSED|nr:PilN domain-containing protein [Pseudomonas reidholzensis]SYX93005.1 Fimbrial protein [Pseudomonas reidholzensis]
MIRLNLLPWRERQRLAAVRRFQRALIGSLLLALCAVMLLDALARQRGQLQAAAIAERQAAIVELDGQLEQLTEVRQAQDGVRARSASLAALRTEQVQLPRLLAELEQAFSSGLQLTELSVQDGRLHLLGLAASPAVIAQLMRDLQQSQLIEALELKHLRADSQGDEFLLVARVSALRR